MARGVSPSPGLGYHYIAMEDSGFMHLGYNRILKTWKKLFVAAPFNKISNNVCAVPQCSRNMR